MNQTLTGNTALVTGAGEMQHARASFAARRAIGR